MKTLYLCGAGNAEGVRLARTVNQHHDFWDRIVILDDNPELHGQTKIGVDIIGPFSLLAEAAPGSEVVNLVARSTQGRWKVMEILEGYGHKIVSLIHPSIDTFGVTLAEGVTAYEHATLSAGSTMGFGSVAFAGSVVGHGSTMSKCCVLAPNAVINARVKLEDRVYVGTNASVLPDLRLEEDVTVGANSSVIQDVPKGATAIGVPAEILGHTYEAEAPTQAAAAEQVVPPEELMEKLTQIWQDLLEIEKVSLTDNFFDLGGTSLLAVQMQRKVREETGVNLALTDVFRFPSLSALGEHVAQKAGGQSAGNSTAQSRAARRRRWQNSQARH